MTPEPTTPTRWGFYEHDTFVPVPRPPLEMAGLVPPCTVTIYAGVREIVVEGAPHTTNLADGYRVTVHPPLDDGAVIAVAWSQRGPAVACEGATAAVARGKADAVVAGWRA